MEFHVLHQRVMEYPPVPRVCMERPERVQEDMAAASDQGVHLVLVDTVAVSVPEAAFLRPTALHLLHMACRHMDQGDTVAVMAVDMAARLVQEVEAYRHHTAFPHLVMELPLSVRPAPVVTAEVLSVLEEVGSHPHMVLLLRLMALPHSVLRVPEVYRAPTVPPLHLTLMALRFHHLLTELRLVIQDTAAVVLEAQVLAAAVLVAAVLAQALPQVAMALRRVHMALLVLAVVTALQEVDILQVDTVPGADIVQAVDTVPEAGTAQEVLVDIVPEVDMVPEAAIVQVVVTDPEAVTVQALEDIAPEVDTVQEVLVDIVRAVDMVPEAVSVQEALVDTVPEADMVPEVAIVQVVVTDPEAVTVQALEDIAPEVDTAPGVRVEVMVPVPVATPVECQPPSARDTTPAAAMLVERPLARDGYVQLKELVSLKATDCVLVMKVCGVPQAVSGCSTVRLTSLFYYIRQRAGGPPQKTTTLI
ncbi:hypothetical protein KGM_210551 [Danaus plexippus plexippus]|uniref:Uncharacterized protein n=1 Tax=Danaus plexippus plexippus TaxID=278856 RepID=A0A212FCS0_DANPL|nr:hypothetical protein KGM_210551 [Danaus plexippus plexippus]